MYPRIAVLALALAVGGGALTLTTAHHNPSNSPIPPIAVSTRPANLLFAPGAQQTLGTIGLTDASVSVFALNADQTWFGLPNGAGGQSFICFSFNPPVSYTSGIWSYDPRIPAVNLAGPDGTPLATLNGLRPGPFPQSGAVSGWHCGPAPGWSFLP